MILFKLYTLDFIYIYIYIYIYRSSTGSPQDVERTKQYEALEKQMKLLAESYGKTTQQLGMLKESVDESKGLLKANIEPPAPKNTFSSDFEEIADDGSLVPQEYVAVVVEIQEFFKQSAVRDAELASLENMARIPQQNVDVEVGKAAGPPSSDELGDCSVITSCVRGLVAMKDTQIEALAKQRDGLCQEVVEKKKIEYKQKYLLDELTKEKEELLKKFTTCKEKYRKAKDEKENMRRDLLVRNATERMTFNHVKNLKVGNIYFSYILKSFAAW